MATRCSRSCAAPSAGATPTTASRRPSSPRCAHTRACGPENLRGWLLTIAHNKAIDHHRANGRRPVPVAEVAETAVEDRLPEPGGAWDAVAALPPKQRAAVTLRFAADLPHAEIAAALGCSPEAARRSLHEGVKRLRKEMA